MKKSNTLSIALVITIIAFDVFVWHRIVFGAPAKTPEFYFLDVGQGDGELVILPGGVKILTDAGPDGKVVKSLEKILSPQERYIDLAVITHPQLDHFNGFNELLKRYEFGAFIVNGRSGTPNVKEWPILVDEINRRHIPLITLAAGDRIKNGESEVDFLSPDATWIQSGELNDTGLVELIKTPLLRALFTADIGVNIEEYLISKGIDLRVDILKVGHHGSKYSSSARFLEKVDPKVAVIEVGKNRYGHPTDEALKRLGDAGIKVFRTDENGTVKIIAEDKKLKVFVGR